MRIAVPILAGLLGAAFAVPLAAAPAAPQEVPMADPPLRYSVEAAPDPMPAPVTPVSVAPAQSSVGGSSPQAPAPRYSVQGTPERVVVTGDTGYRLGPGDKVHVTVYGEADLTGDFEISGNGRLAFPLIGDVQASGLTAPALGAALTQRLAAGYLRAPRVAVEVSTYRPFYIIGEVNKPGQYPYVNGMTALNAIALAGGFTPRAADSTVYVRHEGETKEIAMRADEASQIRPGDVVRVSQSGLWSVLSVLQPVTGLIGAARYGLP